MLCGNTDDHARNDAAFFDGRAYTLTPAYDICPQARTGQEASQAMLIKGQRRESSLALCIEACENFLISRSEAIEIIENQVLAFRDNWSDVVEEAELNRVDAHLLTASQFLNPFAFYGLPDQAKQIASLSGCLR